MDAEKTQAKRTLAAARTRAWAAKRKAADPDGWRARTRAARLRFIANSPGKWKALRQKEASRDRERVRDPIKRVLSHMRESAKKRNIPFAMSAPDVKALFDATPVCPVFGTPFEHGAGWHSPNSPSFDRFLPHLGYIPGNVNLISWRANKIKTDATFDELKQLVGWMESMSNGR